MGFTTPCFIRKSTYKLRKKLDELGYRLFGAELNKDLCIFTEPEYCLYSIEFFSNIPHPDETDSVDCGTNEELFLAIAALRIIQTTINYSLMVRAIGVYTGMALMEVYLEWISMGCLMILTYHIITRLP